jgi:hypothetical protein
MKYMGFYIFFFYSSFSLIHSLYDKILPNIFLNTLSQSTRCLEDVLDHTKFYKVFSLLQMELICIEYHNAYYTVIWTELLVTHWSFLSPTTFTKPTK